MRMNKYNYTYSENDYKTPPEIYKKALEYFGLSEFSLDVCCSDNYIPAIMHYSLPKYNGLIMPWVNFSWCNPPYNECKKWIEKAYKENKERDIVIVMLLPARTETKYWHDFILNNPNCQIQFLKKGYKFLNKDNQEMGIFKNPLALVYFMPVALPNRLLT